MGAQEQLSTLLIWTPFLAEGFLVNLLISFAPMLLGTLLGWGLGSLRASQHRQAGYMASTLTSLFRNIPSFVFLFYIAFLTPMEFSWQGEVYSIPVWLKATLALTVPVIGFASDQTTTLLHELRAGKENCWGMFSIAWTQYLLVVVMASATASVIGVDEIVNRANTVIAAVRDPSLMLWVYGYVALWFLLTGSLISALARAVEARYQRAAYSQKKPA